MSTNSLFANIIFVIYAWTGPIKNWADKGRQFEINNELRAIERKVDVIRAWLMKLNIVGNQIIAYNITVKRMIK